MTYMRTVITKQTAWGSTLHNAEAIKQFITVLEKNNRSQIFAAKHSLQKQNTHISIQINVFQVDQYRT
jgi:hypothetical protein